MSWMILLLAVGAAIDAIDVNNNAIIGVYILLCVSAAMVGLAECTQERK